MTRLLSPSLQRGFVRLSVAIALLHFLVRGVWRALNGSTDLLWGYLASRAWAAGENPYSVAASEALAPVDLPAALHLQGIPAPYAPGYFLLFSPFRWLDWHGAVAATLAVSTLSVGAALLLLVPRLQLSPERRLVVLALVLMGYPLSTGVALGQPSVAALACALAMLALRLGGAGSWWVALLAAGALLFKPQVGIASFLYLALARDFRTVWFALVCYAVPNGFSLLAMWLSGVTIDGLRGALTAVGKVAAQQRDLFCCVNLNQTRLPLPVSLSLIAVPLAWFTWRGWFSALARAPIAPANLQANLQAYGVATSASLLAVYQRPYNLVLLVPLLWFVVSDALPRKQRVGATLLLFPIVQPAPWLPVARLLQDRLPSGFAAAFDLLLRPLHSWLLLAILVLLVLMPSAALTPGASAQTERGN